MRIESPTVSITFSTDAYESLIFEDSVAQGERAVEALRRLMIYAAGYSELLGREIDGVTFDESTIQVELQSVRKGSLELLFGLGAFVGGALIGGVIYDLAKAAVVGFWNHLREREPDSSGEPEPIFVNGRNILEKMNFSEEPREQYEILVDMAKDGSVTLRECRTRTWAPAG